MEDIKTYLSDAECVTKVMARLGWTYFEQSKSCILDHRFCSLVTHRYPFNTPTDIKTLSTFEMGIHDNSVFCVIEMLSAGTLQLSDHSASIKAVFKDRSKIDRFSSGPMLCLIQSFIIVEDEVSSRSTRQKYILITECLILSSELIVPCTTSPEESVTFLVDGWFKRPQTLQYFKNEAKLYGLMSCRASSSNSPTFRKCWIRFTSSYLPLYHSLDINRTANISIPKRAISSIGNDYLFDWTDECTYSPLEMTEAVTEYYTIRNLIQSSFKLNQSRFLVSVEGILASKEIRGITSSSKNSCNFSAIVNDPDYAPHTCVLNLAELEVQFSIFIPTLIPILGLLPGRRIRVDHISLTIRDGNLCGLFLPSSQLQIDDILLIASIPPLESSQTVLLAQLLSTRPPSISWVSVFPIRVLELTMALYCDSCECLRNANTCTNCEGDCRIQVSCEIVVQDGSLECVAVITSFEILQRMLRFETDIVTDELHKGPVSRKFLYGDETSDWLSVHLNKVSWKRRFCLHIVSIPGYMQGMFEYQAPSTIVEPLVLRPKTYIDLEKEVQVSLSIKFLKVSVANIRILDPAQEAFAILSDI